MIGRLLSSIRWSSPSQIAQSYNFKQKTLGLRRRRPAGSPCVSRVHYVIGALMAAGKNKKKQKNIGGVRALKRLEWIPS